MRIFTNTSVGCDNKIPCKQKNNAPKKPVILNAILLLVDILKTTNKIPVYPTKSIKLILCNS